MERPIIRDTMLLMKKASLAGKEDIPAAIDLRDTLLAHSSDCAGLAANMIGVNKSIIAFFAAGIPVVMLNPSITAHSSESYETEEGCLSLSGVRRTVRYRQITVEYQDLMMKKHRTTYSGYIAQVIQHETDHLKGILI